MASVSITGIVIGAPVVSSDTEGRRSSPFRSRGARSESAEHVRSAKTAASAEYRKLAEDVISPLMAGLTTRMGAVEVRMDTHESASKQEIDGLKRRISQLEATNSQLTEQYNACLARIVTLERNLTVVSEVAADHHHVYWTSKAINTSSVASRRHMINGQQRIQLS